MRGSLNDPQLVGRDRSAELRRQLGAAPPLPVSQQMADLGDRQGRNY